METHVPTAERCLYGLTTKNIVKKYMCFSQSPGCAAFTSSVKCLLRGSVLQFQASFECVFYFCLPVHSVLTIVLTFTYTLLRIEVTPVSPSASPASSPPPPLSSSLFFSCPSPLPLALSLSFFHHILLCISCFSGVCIDSFECV